MTGLNDYTTSRLKELQDDIAEMERDRKMERYSYPLFIVVFVAAFAVVWLEIADSYDNEQQRKAMSQMIAGCANGQVVALGKDAVMKCNVKELIGRDGK